MAILKARKYRGVLNERRPRNRNAPILIERSIVEKS